MNFPRHTFRNRTTGFTLVEGLAVLAIIAVMLGALQMSTQPTEDQKLRGAHALAGALIREARLTALQRLARVRLLVNDEDEQARLKRRGVAIVAETAADSNQWEVVGVPEVLPQGIVWVLLNDGGHVAQEAPGRIGGWLPNAHCVAYEFLPTGRISALRYTFGIGPGSIVAGEGDVVLTRPKDVMGWTVTSYGVGAEVEKLGEMMAKEP